MAQEQNVSSSAFICLFLIIFAFQSKMTVDFPSAFPDVIVCERHMVATRCRDSAWKASEQNAWLFPQLPRGSKRSETSPASMTHERRSKTYRHLAVLTRNEINSRHSAESVARTVKRDMDDGAEKFAKIRFRCLENSNDSQDVRRRIPFGSAAPQGVAVIRGALRCLVFQAFA